MDPVHGWTDEEIGRLERRIAREYGTAAREMRTKLDKFLKKYAADLEAREKALDGTPEAMEALEAWKRDRAADRTWMQSMITSLSRDLEQARERAMGLVEDRLPGIYAENMSYGAFEVDRAAGVDTAFTMMDEDTARQLMGEGRLLFEPPRPDAAKVRAWTDRKLASAMTQGILQGESIPHIADRLRTVAGMSASASIRTARTACTGAENAGRVSSYLRAQRLGIGLRQEWLATLDTRTRDSHRVLDGERVQVGEEFSNGLRFPGDPQGPAREVYNCRCTLVAAVDGVDQSAAARFSRLPDGMSYEDWKEQARRRMEGELVGEPSIIRTPDRHVVEGRDILGTWQRRPDQFDFEIEDVINAQGFDGKPRIVGAEDFDKAVKQANGGNGLVMQRVYSAPDQDTLDAYRESLYDGKWYVDCSHGNDTYGKGMYTVSSKSTSVTQQMADEIAPYRREFSYTETMTLDPSARVIGYNEVVVAKNDASVLERAIIGSDDISDTERAIVRREVLREYSDEDRELARAAEREWDFDDYMAVIKKYSQKEREFRELGTSEVAALLGYDAVEVPGLNYTVVLNRTKLIIRRPE